MTARVALAAGFALAAAALVASAARANGLDLSQTAGKPGEEVGVAGHLWLTCCPQRPYGRVRLYLIAGSDRIELFEERPDQFGSVFSTFEVPDVRPGVYELEPCGSDDDRGDQSLECRPSVAFQVLAGPAGGGFGGTRLVAVLVPAGLLVTAAVFIVAMRRRARARGASDEGSASG